MGKYRVGVCLLFCLLLVVEWGQTAYHIAWDPSERTKNWTLAKGERLTISPNADTYVSEESPNSNFGSSATIYIGGGYIGMRHRGLFKFDLSSIPAGSVIISAVLKVYWSVRWANDEDVGCYAVSSDSWNELSVTWNNQPAHGDLLDTVPSGQWGWNSWTVTTFVQQEFEGNKIASFKLMYYPETTLGWREYRSREASSKRPYLSVTYDLPPNAPTLDNPAANTHFNPLASITFSWTFNDPDTGDSQSAYQFQLDDNNDFSSPIIDTGKVTSTASSTTQTLPSTVGLYYWRVKTWDSYDVEGDWSSGRVIIVDNVPNAPTLNFPLANARFNPLESVTFTWTFNDPDTGDWQSAYQFQLDDDSDFSSPIIDSGKSFVEFGSWVVDGNTYNYRLKINVTENSGTSLSDYQVKITLNTEELVSNGFATSSGNEVRFTDDDGSLLYFWRENSFNQSSTIYWVKIPSIPASSTVSIYMYFDSDLTTVSDASDSANTFIFFDDFETWSGWTVYGSGTVSQSSDYAKEGMYSLKKGSNNDPNGGYKLIGSTIGLGYVFEGWIYRPSGYTGGGQDRLAIEDGSFNGYGFRLDHSSNVLNIEKRTDGSGSDVGSTVSFNPPENAWYKFVFVMKSNKNFSIYIYDSSDNLLSSIKDRRDETYSSFDRVVVHGGHQFYVDMIRIRKYVDPEPTVEIIIPYSHTAQLPSTVGIYYWRVKTWDSYDAEGEWSEARPIIVDRIKIIGGGVVNFTIDVDIGGKVWYYAVYEYGNSTFDGSRGVLYVNGFEMTWDGEKWIYAFPYSTEGNQMTFHITGVLDNQYGLTEINNQAGDIIINWATMTVEIKK